MFSPIPFQYVINALEHLLPRVIKIPIYDPIMSINRSYAVHVSQAFMAVKLNHRVVAPTCMC